MRLFKLASALAALSLVAGASGAHAVAVTVVEGTPAAQCKGNACQQVLFEVDGG